MGLTTVRKTRFFGTREPRGWGCQYAPTTALDQRERGEGREGTDLSQHMSVKVWIEVCSLAFVCSCSRHIASVIRSRGSPWRGERGGRGTNLFEEDLEFSLIKRAG
jgi:hypothetical protein